MTHLSRRRLLIAGAGGIAGLIIPRAGSGQIAKPSGGTRPDVAAIEHDRIVASAEEALKLPVTPITSLRAERTPGSANDFYSEPEDYFPAPDGAPWTRRPDGVNPEAFGKHRDAVYELGRAVAALTAAQMITGEKRYGSRAAEHLRAWFIAPATRMTSSLQYGQRIPGIPAGRAEGVIETVPLAEVARSLRFIAKAEALTDEEVMAVRKWFAEYATWLNESRTGGLARDMKDLHGSSWLFQSAAYADANVIGLTSDDATLNALRHRFRNSTLRAEINGNGVFFHVVSSQNPYRDSLFNLDLLCLACSLLTTRFDDPWEFELQDGPGMRAAIAYHFPAIANRAVWSYPADLTHFKELPGRRTSLLLAGRAYRRPDYTDLWRALQPLPASETPQILRTFVVTEPVLWF